MIQKILQNHFSDSDERYDDHCEKKYGKYRIIRIKQVVERFIECGDYSKGVTYIKCTNPYCKHEYFRPFSCKRWHLCPGCNQKRLQLFQNTSGENLLLKLPHKKFVFTILQLLRVYFKHDSNLFEDFSKIIFSIINDYYSEVVTKASYIVSQVLLNNQSISL